MQETSQSKRSHKMELWGSGFNAHGQLQSIHPQNPSPHTHSDPQDDVFEFRQIAQGNNIKITYAGWCQTVLFIDGLFISLGSPFRRIDHAPPSSGELSTSLPAEHIPKPSRAPISAFGTESDGLQGYINAETNCICTVNAIPPAKSPNTPPFTQPTITHPTPRLAAIATTSAGVTATVSHPTGPTFTLDIFDSLPTFLDSIAKPTPTARTTHTLPGRPAHLAAHATGFVLLTADGNVWTWGDGRYPPTLARRGGASAPGIVDALAGCGVVKVAAGGWVCGCVSAAGEAWLWGCSAPGAGQSVLRGVRAGEVVKVEAPAGARADGAEFVVVDLAVGDGHVLLLDAEGAVWGCGRNAEGQLGGGRLRREFEVDWVRLEVATLSGGLDWRVKGVACGNLTSFAILESTNRAGGTARDE